EGEDQQRGRKQRQHPTQHNARRASSLTASAMYELRTSGPLKTALKPSDMPSSRYASNWSGSIKAETGKSRRVGWRDGAVGATAARSPQKSGVRASTRACGSAPRTSRTVSAK